MLVIVLYMLLFTGCWNYKEINDKSVVAGAALDYDKDTDELVLTVEIAIARTEQNNTIILSDTYQGRGWDVFDASRNLIAITGQKLYWSHTKIIIFSRSIMENKNLFIGVLDWIKRDSETRDDIWFFLSGEDTAAEILTDTRVQIENITSYYLEDIARNEKSVSKYLSVPCYEFVDDLGSKGITPVLPTVKIEAEGENVIPVVYGEALLKGLKPEKWLNGEQTKILLILKDKLRGGLLVIKGEYEGKETVVTLEILKSKTKITSKAQLAESNEITMSVNVKMDVVIAGIDGEADVITKKNRKKLKQDAENKVKENIGDLMSVLQQECGCDAVGFGRLVEIEHPEVWKRIEPDWNAVFPFVKTDVNVEISIKGSALRSEPVAVK